MNTSALNVNELPAPIFDKFPVNVPEPGTVWLAKVRGGKVFLACDGGIDIYAGTLPMREYSWLGNEPVPDGKYPVYVSQSGEHGEITFGVKALGKTAAEHIRSLPDDKLNAFFEEWENLRDAWDRHHSISQDY
jgi:hypothetical protein